ncbi:MAG: ABC transporter permease [Planctomycetes bacterium]|nr:ABC transporter permease [Planctomycetota bacterium]
MLRGLANCWRIARKSLRQHALSSTVTVGSAALASGLVMSVFALSAQSREAFSGGETGFDAVLGAKGSELQLVMNTVFHLDTSPGNIPWSLYQAAKEDRRVEAALPYAVGDNYKGFRIVGTTEDVFTEFHPREGERLELEPGGRAFDPAYREAVIGSVVAQRTGLGVGSKFLASHGVTGAGDTVHPGEYVVVGVLKPTNAPTDRVIWIPIEGIFRMEGHKLTGAGEVYEAKPGEEIPDEHKEISAVMIRTKGSGAGRMLEFEINKGDRATLAWPISESILQVFDKLGWVVLVLEGVAVLVVVVAAASILASLYNTMNERRKEFAVLRALGARRRTVFGVIVIESTTIAGLGALLGGLVYLAAFSVAAKLVRDKTGVVLDPTMLHPALWWTPVGMLLMGALAGLLPAFKAYRTEVATTLAGGGY